MAQQSAPAYQHSPYSQDLQPPSPQHQAPGYQYQQQQQQQQQYYPPSTSSNTVTAAAAAAPAHPPQTSSHTREKSRSFSRHSDRHSEKKSRKSSIKSTEDVTPSAHQRHHSEKRIQSKADPTLAMNEAEPSVIAAMTESSLASLRDVQHKDAFGNPIADPDLSNPTRNRWERPLDTIRSFEAAIDGGYKRRSMVRSETMPSGFNRHSSHNLANQPRFKHDSYYGNRPVSFRPEQTQFTLSTPHSGPLTSRNSVVDARGYFDDGANGQAPGPVPRRYSRQPMDGYYNQPNGRDQDVYRLAHKDRSYETVTSAAGSRTSEPVGYQTDPTSSDNSSIERRSPAKRGDLANEHGMGYGQPQPYQQGMGYGYSTSNRPGQAPPPPAHGTSQPPQQQQQQTVPRKGVPSVLRRQVPAQQQMHSQVEKPAAPEKRKSWLSRRFSKNT